MSVEDAALVLGPNVASRLSLLMTDEGYTTFDGIVTMLIDFFLKKKGSKLTNKSPRGRTLSVGNRNWRKSPDPDRQSPRMLAKRSQEPKSPRLRISPRRNKNKEAHLSTSLDSGADSKERVNDWGKRLANMERDPQQHYERDKRVTIHVESTSSDDVVSELKPQRRSVGAPGSFLKQASLRHSGSKIPVVTRASDRSGSEHLGKGKPKRPHIKRRSLNKAQRDVLSKKQSSSVDSDSQDASSGREIDDQDVKAWAERMAAIEKSPANLAAQPRDDAQSDLSSEDESVVFISEKNEALSSEEEEVVALTKPSAVPPSANSKWIIHGGAELVDDSSTEQFDFSPMPLRSRLEEDDQTDDSVETRRVLNAILDLELPPLNGDPQTTADQSSDSVEDSSLDISAELVDNSAEIGDSIAESCDTAEFQYRI